MTVDTGKENNINSTTSVTLKTDFEGEHPLAQKSRLDYLPLLILVMLIFNFFSSCNNSAKLNNVIKNKPYIYVQTLDGDIVKGKEVEDYSRSDQVIRRYALSWLQLAFTWNYQKSTSSNYVNEGGMYYPHGLYVASLGIKPGNREMFLANVRKKYNDKFRLENYISGRNQSYLKIFDSPIITPVIQNQKIVPGLWDVKIVATRIHGQGSSIIAKEIFNKVIRLQAVYPTDGNEFSANETELGKLLNQMQQSGLQVLSVTEF